MKIGKHKSKKALLADLEHVCAMASDLVGCYHPDEMAGLRDMIDATRASVREVVKEHGRKAKPTYDEIEAPYYYGR